MAIYEWSQRYTAWSEPLIVNGEVRSPIRQQIIDAVQRLREQAGQNRFDRIPEPVIEPFHGTPRFHYSYEIGQYPHRQYHTLDWNDDARKEREIETIESYLDKIEGRLNHDNEPG